MDVESVRKQIDAFMSEANSDPLVREFKGLKDDIDEYLKFAIQWVDAKCADHAYGALQNARGSLRDFRARQAATAA